MTVGADWSTVVDDEEEVADETPVKLMPPQPLRRRAIRLAVARARAGREKPRTSGKVAVFGRRGEIEQVFT